MAVVVQSCLCGIALSIEARSSLQSLPTIFSINSFVKCVFPIYMSFQNRYRSRSTMMGLEEAFLARSAVIMARRRVSNTVPPILRSRSSWIIDLDLSLTMVGATGANAVATFIKCNNNLQRLNLSHNRIRPPSAIRILQAIAKNRCLREIRLVDNLLNGQVSSTVISALLLNDSLVLLDLRRNKFSESSTVEILNGCVCNPESVMSVVSSNHHCFVR